MVHEFYDVQVDSFYANFLEVFYHKRVLNFIESFIAFMEIIMWFLCFNLLICCIMLINLHILKHLCIPWNYLTWSWHMILIYFQYHGVSMSIPDSVTVLTLILPSLFRKFVYFNWRLITLQNCSGFAIHWHESAMGVHVSPILIPLPPPSPSHPSGSSQCTSPEHPVSCTEPGLVICFTYGNIHVLMLFSQIISPSPSPTESKRLFYICASFAVSHVGL